MEMNDLRWILLGVAIIIIVGVYFFSRARKKIQSETLLQAADDMPSFSANEDGASEDSAGEKASNNDWMDGVGPVRVVSGDDKSIPEIKFIGDDEADVSSARIDPLINNALQKDTAKPDLKPAIETDSVLQKSSPVDSKASIEVEASVSTESKQQGGEQQKSPSKTDKQETTNKNQSIVDDVISVYVLAKVEEKIKGEKILSASYALHLDYGEMKIFHRHQQTADRKIEFSMANVQAPGWFEIDGMNDMETTGVSFFMQVNLVGNPSAVLDEMLICAHNLSTMLGATLCNGQRKVLDETSTIELRERVKRLEEIKAQAV